MFKFIKKMLMGTGEDCKQIVAEKGAIIVDVRTVEEFAGGHIEGSKNIPLDQISAQSSKIKAWNKPVVLCCMAGGRAGQAMSTLKAKGVEAYNAGSWINLK